MLILQTATTNHHHCRCIFCSHGNSTAYWPVTKTAQVNGSKTTQKSGQLPIKVNVK
jgi:hypothetical protein